MSDSYCLLTDTHGAFYTLIRLLNQVAAQHPGVRLICLGDTVDRGPHSRQVVEFLMEHKIPTTSGNHEDLVLAFSAHYKRGYRAKCSPYYDYDVWLMNGGEETLASWNPDMTERRKGLPKDVLDWMAALPPYIVLDTVDEKGRKCLAGHTGYGLDADTGNWFRALWGRHAHGDGDFPNDNHHRVFGHTQSRNVQSGDGWHMIDTGAAYHARGLGTLTALIWPTKTLVQQSFDESPVEQRFKVVDGRLVP